MPEHRTESEPSNLNLSSLLLGVFKRKKTILISALAGATAAAAVYLLWPHTYESDAALLVRYVLDRSAVDPETIAGGAVGSLATKTNDTFINAEVSILTSWDLAVQVAEALGPKRVLPDAKGNPSIAGAAGAISSGLKVASAKNSNVIQVSYTNTRPAVATAVLNELVNRYFTKHLEVHRSAGAFDFVSQQSDQIRARLNQTEDALKMLKAKAGVLSLQDSTTSLGAQSSHLDDQIRAAESDLAEQQARVRQIEKGGGPVNLNETEKSTDNAAVPSPTPGASTQETAEYQALVSNLAHMRQTQLEMTGKYTPENVLVKMNQAHINDMENQKRTFVKKYAKLATTVGKGGRM